MQSYPHRNISLATLDYDLHRKGKDEDRQKPSLALEQYTGGSRKIRITKELSWKRETSNFSDIGKDEIKTFHKICCLNVTIY